MIQFSNKHGILLTMDTVLTIIVTNVKENESIYHYLKVSEKLNLLEEILQDDVEQLTISEDADAKIGHKRADSSFFGYKAHIAMTEERIITAATITTGEKMMVNN